jgi:hypothetical protein
MAELAQRWAITANTVSRRLAFLGIKPIRQGNYRYLTQEQLELAEALHHHIQGGKPMETFPRPQHEGEAMAIARRSKPEPNDSMLALASAMAALKPAADPLQQARRLKEAADLDVWLSNAELAAVLGMAESTLRDKSQDYSPRPGFTLERRQDSKGGAIWWRVRKEGGTVRALPTSGATSRQVGFGAAVEATIVSSVTLPSLPFLGPSSSF